MLVVKIEFWPHGKGKEHAHCLGTMVIANTGGSGETADYTVVAAREGSQPMDPDAVFSQYDRRGEIKAHSALGEPVWALVAKGLHALGFTSGIHVNNAKEGEHGQQQ